MSLALSHSDSDLLVWVGDFLAAGAELLDDCPLDT